MSDSDGADGSGQAADHLERAGDEDDAHPSLPGDVFNRHHLELADVPERWPVRDAEEVLSAEGIVRVVRERVGSARGESFSRDVVLHPGSVGIVALDDEDRMLLIQQYRHPVGHRLFEAPAGLLDVEDEDPLATAQRELVEEGYVNAGQWQLLVDAFSSPGMSDEVVRIYLARELEPVPEDERHSGRHEEADLCRLWVPLDDVVDGVLAGRLHNPLLVMGALAAWVARNGQRPARDPNTDWRVRQDLPDR